MTMKKPDRVLVVDDDPIIRDMIVDILEPEGYVVETARNGRDALALLRKAGDASYLIFVDLMMPVMDGHEFCLTLDADPALRSRQIVILMSAMDRLTEAASLNADAVMPKPFFVEDIMRVLP
jgi:CheY-like chemotaxis protein